MGKVFEKGHACNEAGLALDADRIEIVLRTRDAPAAPLGLPRYNDRIGSRDGMACAIFRGLPFVPGAHDAPILVAAMAVLGQRLFALQFVRGEFAAQSHIVVNAQRLIDSLRPMRHHALDKRPCAHRLHVNTLVLVEICLGHPSRNPFSSPLR